jgi:hypothetical protein
MRHGYDCLPKRPKTGCQHMPTSCRQPPDGDPRGSYVGPRKSRRLAPVVASCPRSRKRMGIEPTVPPLARSTIGFEDRAWHQSRSHFHRGCWSMGFVKSTRGSPHFRSGAVARPRPGCAAGLAAGRVAIEGYDARARSAIGLSPVRLWRQRTRWARILCFFEYTVLRLICISTAISSASIPRR